MPKLLRLLGGVRRDVLPMRFSPEDELRFRHAMRRNLIYARTGIFLAMALGFGLAPFYHDALFQPAPAVEPRVTLVEIATALLTFATALLTALPGPAALRKGAQTIAVMGSLLATITFRALALDGTMVYPAQMTGIIMIAFGAFCGFAWQRIAAGFVLATVVAVVVEFTRGGPATAPFLQSYMVTIMALIAILGAYNLETLARFTWWESSQLRRIRAELLESERLVRLQSMTDELTGHYNRRGFALLAQQELRHSRRRQQTCALFFVDVDGLKGINERHGHDGGDQALVTVAEALRVAARNTDIVARLGGDEFLVFAVDCEDVEAMQRRIREHLDSYNAAHTLPFTLSVSIGVTPIAAGTELTLEQLIAQADARMYAAKRERGSEAA